jgi:hypothetical protein
MQDLKDDSDQKLEAQIQEGMTDTISIAQDKQKEMEEKYEDMQAELEETNNEIE